MKPTVLFVLLDISFKTTSVLQDVMSDTSFQESSVKNVKMDVPTATELDHVLSVKQADMPTTDFVTLIVHQDQLLKLLT